MAGLTPKWKRPASYPGFNKMMLRAIADREYRKDRAEFIARIARHKAARLANFTASNNGVLGQLLGVEPAKPYEKGIF